MGYLSAAHCTSAHSCGRRRHTIHFRRDVKLEREELKVSSVRRQLSVGCRDGGWARHRSPFVLDADTLSNVPYVLENLYDICVERAGTARHAPDSSSPASAGCPA